MRILQATTVAALTVCFSAQSALTIHKAPVKKQAMPVQAGSHLPENQTIKGRGRAQRLEDALKTITRRRMDVQFVTPELKDLQINWRSSNEPMQIILTQVGRGYGVDFVINEVQETVFVDVDIGQCDPSRERELRSTSQMWKSLNLDGSPTLPPHLRVPTDQNGYEYRLC
ncbi:hypothetical protein AAFX24_28400 [Vibrio mediterranei]|uniref:hypothetical protein n=1 Tax=Vibrio mediterranei TaxID=689 RepID=UPI0038CE02A1